MEERLDCVWHDGTRVKDSALVAMAKKAGSYALAEHYLVSLMAHGVMYGYDDYIDMVNEVRAYYQVERIPVKKQEKHEVLIINNKRRFYDDLRRRYQRMSIPEREQLIMDALVTMTANHPDLFRKRNHWQGIYLVVRDRLDYGLSQVGFLVMACHATPRTWPEKLQLTENVFKNMSRDYGYDDLSVAYYEMENNPQAALCDTFWETLIEVMGNDGEMC